jgi:hypothetical protein
MPEKMAKSAPQPPFRAARGDGSCPNLASVLQEGRPQGRGRVANGIGTPIASPAASASRTSLRPSVSSNCLNKIMCVNITEFVFTPLA